MADDEKANAKLKRAAAAGILLLVVLAHVLRIGRRLPDSLSRIYSSYFSDVAIPVATYFLLTLMKDPRFAFLQDWRRKALVVFGLASFAEILQAFHVPLLGRTFDPLDFAMYAIGVALAVLIEKVLLDRLP